MGIIALLHHLLKVGSPLVSHKAQCWVLFCSSNIPILSVRSFHSWVFQCYTNGTQNFLFVPPSGKVRSVTPDTKSWMPVHHLYIPADASPCQELVTAWTTHHLSFPETLWRPRHSSLTLALILPLILFLLIRTVWSNLSTQATLGLIQCIIVWRLDKCNSLLADLLTFPVHLIQNAGADVQQVTGCLI